MATTITTSTSTTATTTAINLKEYQFQLTGVLNNRETREQFRLLLKREFNEEPLLFWESVHEVIRQETHDLNRLQELIQQTFKRYIPELAPKQINLSSHEVRIIRDRIKRFQSRVFIHENTNHSSTSSSSSSSSSSAAVHVNHNNNNSNHKNNNNNNNTHHTSTSTVQTMNRKQEEEDRREIVEMGHNIFSSALLSVMESLEKGPFSRLIHSESWHQFILYKSSFGTSRLCMESIAVHSCSPSSPATLKKQQQQQQDSS